MIALLLTLALIGFVVWLLVSFIPMPEPFRKGIIVLAVILVILYLLRLFNLDIPVPHS